MDSIDIIRRLYCPMTPIGEIPQLIELFAKHIKTTPDLARSITSQQVVPLFDRLLDCSDKLEFYYPDGRHCFYLDQPNRELALTEGKVADLVMVLVNAVNRPEITNLISVMLSPTRHLYCLNDKVMHPTLSGIPQVVIDAIKDMPVTPLSPYCRLQHDRTHPQSVSSNT